MTKLAALVAVVVAVACLRAGPAAAGQPPITRDFRVDYVTGAVTMIDCEQGGYVPGVSTPMPPPGRVRDVRVDFTTSTVMAITCTNAEVQPAYLPAAWGGRP